MRFRRFDQPLFRLEGPGGPAVRAALIIAVAALLGLGVAAIWLVPRDVVRGDEPVPEVIGLDEADARTRIERAGFRPRIEGAAPSPITPAGLISWQEPVAGIRLQSGGVVRLTRSTGPEPVAIPEVRELDAGLARTVIEAAGFRVEGVDSTAAGTPRGAAVATRPPAGTVRLPGEPVTLVVSRGPADRMVPAVQGLTIEAARDKIQAAGLRVGTVRPPAAPGAIVSGQRPGAGARAPADAPVDLTIGEGGRP
ncbi:MAG TPA: PASTA domain-containing protein [Gemmatimonadales bacterium]|nr:PASTA domain-containing protein [Gemmatimonadales bacterium]